ncbi:MAG: SDR family NAD(P)-dependent oxidoreductase [Spirochaetales bacterium]|nr:SDR family NAD(P)-dependent oxidoreductase [Spirochaetales bacterium]
MSEVVLIAGSETLLGRKLVEKELDRGNRVVAPVNSTKDGGSGETSRENLLVIPWNKPSLFSAKTILQESVRRWGSLDRAYLLENVPREGGLYTDLSFSDLDRIVDREIKGFLYLSHLLLNYLKEQGRGSLFFVTPHRGDRNDSMGRGCSAFFRETADAILCEKPDGITLAGFLSRTTNVESSAGSILALSTDLPEKARGEWLRITEKKNPFNSLSIEKRNEPR